MIETIKTLETINMHINLSQTKRTGLKKELYEEQAEKAFNERVLAGRELLAETPVYLYDIEKKYGNDKARSTAVKSILNDDEIYNAAIDRINEAVKKINELDLKLRENQIEISYLLRRYEINVLYLKAGDNHE